MHMHGCAAAPTRASQPTAATLPSPRHPPPPDPTLQPYRSFRPDGVILFSDILTPLPGIGVPFEIDDNKGPLLDAPIRTKDGVREDDVQQMRDAIVALSLREVSMWRLLLFVHQQQHLTDVLCFAEPLFVNILPPPPSAALSFLC